MVPVQAAAKHDYLARQQAPVKPTVLFLVLSCLFGTLTVAFAPPLRGPDEPAHFVRAYSLLVGEIVPSTTDALGRKGVFLPGSLHAQMEVFEGPLARHKRTEFSVPGVFDEYARLRMSAGDSRLNSAATAWETALVFKPYDGSEGYSPAAYLPYLPAIAIARYAGLDFVATLYLMRMTGLLVLTSVIGVSIALMPSLKWGFMMIAMLPSALYGRSVLSADGAALASAMLITALCLRAALSVGPDQPWIRAICMTFCVLTKPPQLAFVLLEGMRIQSLRFGKAWRTALLVILPAAFLAIGWTAVTSADVAIWRITHGSELDPRQFDPIWKLNFMFERPAHFLMLLGNTYQYMDDYWLQLIGVMGWLDTLLHPLLYPLLSVLLLVTFCARLEADFPTRRRIVTAGIATTIAYTFTVFMIFYLVWTGIDAAQIEGVQGRYFVMILPLFAVSFSGFVRGGLSETTQACAATLGALLSGAGILEAIMRTDWNWRLFH